MPPRILDPCQRLCWALVALLLWSTSLKADSLRSLRDDVRTPAEPAPAAEPEPEKKDKKKKKRKDQGYITFGCEEEEEEDDNVIDLGGVAVLTGMVMTSPYWLPHGLLEEGGIHGDAYFAPYPYGCNDGFMLFDAERRGIPPPDAYCWATRIRSEYADDFSGLTRYSGHALVEHANRWGFDSEVNYWQESVSPGEHDSLWTGDANVLFRFAQDEYCQMRSGIGVAWLADDIDTELGFNFTYGGDIYPIKPLVFSAELDAGWIGEAWLIHLRSTIGVQWQQVEVYTGYDYLEIGSTQLDGWIAGVRLTF